MPAMDTKDGPEFPRRGCPGRTSSLVEYTRIPPIDCNGCFAWPQCASCTFWRFDWPGSTSLFHIANGLPGIVEYDFFLAVRSLNQQLVGGLRRRAVASD